MSNEDPSLIIIRDIFNNQDPPDILCPLFVGPCSRRCISFNRAVIENNTVTEPQCTNPAIIGESFSTVSLYPDYELKRHEEERRAVQTTINLRDTENKMYKQFAADLQHNHINPITVFLDKGNNDD